MKTRLRLSLIVVAIVALALGIAGAGQSAHQQLTAVKYTTSFGTFGREAYVYAAIEKGYFRDAGLDVSVQAGQGSVAVARLIAAGQVDYGPGDPVAIALARGNEGLPVKMVALIHQKILTGYMSLEETGIKTPKDLEGKKIGDTPGSVGRVIFPFYAKRAGIDESKVTFINTTAQALPALLVSKQIDAAAQFAVGLPTFQAAAADKKVVFLAWDKVLPNLTGNAFWTSEKKLRENPDEVRRFTNALLRGLKYAIDNPGDTGRILNKYIPLANPVLAAKELRIMKRYVQTADTLKNGVGYVDPKRVATVASIVNNFFKPKERVTVADLYATGFLPAKPIK